MLIMAISAVFLFPCMTGIQFLILMKSTVLCSFLSCTCTLLTGLETEPGFDRDTELDYLLDQSMQPFNKHSSRAQSPSLFFSFNESDPSSASSEQPAYSSSAAASVHLSATGNGQINAQSFGGSQNNAGDDLIYIRLKAFIFLVVVSSSQQPMQPTPAYSSSSSFSNYGKLRTFMPH